MLTTCPECHTSFRVSQAQLDQRRGLVRCGRCSAVFNAYDTLLPELAAPVREEAAPAPAEAAPAGTAQPPRPLSDATPAAGGSAEIPTPPAAESAPAAITHRPDGDEFRAAWLRTPSEPRKAPHETLEASAGLASAVGPASPLPAAETADAILLSALPTGRKRGLPGWRGTLWFLASLILTLSFLLQITYFLRAEIAASWPQTRPSLEEACRLLGCRLPLPQDVSALRLEASSLETDPEDPTHATLRVSLSNRSDRTVAWPHLVLILTDVRDLPVAQRPFPPSVYLTDAGDEALGMAPGEEREIRLDLELKGLTAYGYKLDMQYP